MCVEFKGSWSLESSVSGKGFLGVSEIGNWAFKRLDQGKEGQECHL